MSKTFDEKKVTNHFFLDDFERCCKAFCALPKGFLNLLVKTSIPKDKQFDETEELAGGLAMQKLSRWSCCVQPHGANNVTNRNRTHRADRSLPNIMGNGENKGGRRCRSRMTEPFLSVKTWRPECTVHYAEELKSPRASINVHCWREKPHQISSFP